MKEIRFGAGRPSRKIEIVPAILEILETTGTPMGRSHIIKYLEEREIKASWKTVNFYLTELIKMKKIKATLMSTTKDDKKHWAYELIK